MLFNAVPTLLFLFDSFYAVEAVSLNNIQNNWSLDWDWNQVPPNTNYPNDCWANLLNMLMRIVTNNDEWVGLGWHQGLTPGFGGLDSLQNIGCHLNSHMADHLRRLNCIQLPWRLQLFLCFSIQESISIIVLYIKYYRNLRNVSMVAIFKFCKFQISDLSQPISSH